MSAGLYRSDTPVSARVDIAWKRGYDVGVKDGRRLALVASLVAVWTFTRRNRIHPVWVILAALVAIPGVVLFVTVRALVRADRHRRALARATAGMAAQTVTLSDGTVF